LNVAITFVAVQAWTGSSGSASIVLTVPTGVSDGDVLLAIVSNRNAAAHTVPGGWALVASATQLTVYSHVAASEPANYTWSWTGACQTGGSIIAYRGVNTGSILDAAPTTGYASVASLNTVTPGAMVVVAGAGQDNITAPGGSWTNRLLYNAGGIQRISYDDKLMAVAGATGSVSLTGGVYASQIPLRPILAGARGTFDAPLRGAFSGLFG
jgi:hypothetical protein